MGKKLSIKQHWQDVWDIFQVNGLYLVNLNFLIGIQLLIFGGGLALFYFGNVPWPITMVVALICVSFFNISLTGVSKNLFAMGRERGPGKYPVFHPSYFWLGLPVLLTYLVVAVVPVLVMVVLVLSLLNGQFDYWLLVLAGSYLFYLIWQWFFGLAPAVTLDKKTTLPSVLQESFDLVCRQPFYALGLLLLDQALLIVASFVPIVGTFFAINWISISSFHLYWELQS